MKKIIFLILSMSLILAGGCASTRQSHFYVLSSEAQPVPATSAKYSVSVGPVTVPAAVDRPQIIIHTGQNQIFISEFDRWASPLKVDIARVVTDNLIKLLGIRQVSIFSQSAAAEAKYQVMIDFLHFEPESREAVNLDAFWMIVYGKDGQFHNHTTISEPVHGGGYDEIVAAHSRAIGRLSADIAAGIKRLEGK